MRIKQLEISNYKGFRSSGKIPIGPNFTVVVGQNNSGKTALLEAFNPKELKNVPHQYPPVPTGQFPRVPLRESAFAFDLSFTGQELEWRLIDKHLQLLLPTDAGTLEDAARSVETLFKSDDIPAYATYRPQGWHSSGLTKLLSGNPNRHIDIRRRSDNQGIEVVNVIGNTNDNFIHTIIGPYAADAMYVFRAERSSAGECPIGGNTDLSTDASNLASVLLHLDGNLRALEQYTSYIREIFPMLHSVISRPREDKPNVARIEVVIRDSQSPDPKPGIYLPLADCGTGISQVLAILYVVVAAKTPRTIVIDEPNSFLHPGAMRKLINILKGVKHHQYILSTHSADVIQAVEPDVIVLSKWTGQECAVEALNRDDVQHMRKLLNELGVCLSDVFGFDAVLWVEGETEEICFPLLYAAAEIPIPSGTTILSVIKTGDFNIKHKPRAELVWELYETLSGGPFIIPPALSFSFDREKLTSTKMADMVRMSQGRAHFLPRRTYENYLIEPSAISAILSDYGVNKSEVDVKNWLKEHGGKSKYVEGEFSTYDAASWYEHVDAPTLLEDLFWCLGSDTPVEFDKVTHSVALTRWLIANRPGHLAELSEYLKTLVAPAVIPTTASQNV